jgi:uncharacterized protein YecE (DUF72 family)
MPTHALNGTGALRIGISGWTYAPWRGTFFPKGLAQKGELAFASQRVNSIEINGTFYSLQRPASYALWHSQTPECFVFSVKGPRCITHIKRLGNVEIPLANFFASGPLRLGEKLGPFLWQLPPSFAFDRARLEAFFNLLPRTTKAAARLGRRHDDHVKHGTWLRVDADRPLRHALEVRHASFKTVEFIELLRAHDVGLVVADTAGKWPAMEDVTSNFVYVRLHGDEKLYVSGYTPEALDSWSDKIRSWARGASPPGPYDAMAIAHRLGLNSPPEAGPLESEVDEEPRTQWPPYARPRSKVKARPGAPVRGS